MSAKELRVRGQRGGLPDRRGYSLGGALERSLGDLIKPLRVRKLKVTALGADVVSGFVLVNCPVEDTECWRDFEAHLTEERDGRLAYAVVDGKPFYPQPEPSRSRSNPSVFR